MKPATNHEIMRLRRLAASQYSKTEAGRALGRPRMFVDYWTRKLNMRFPGPMYQPAAAEAAARLVRATMARLAAVIYERGSAEIPHG
jgi:hypothetical protein